MSPQNRRARRRAGYALALTTALALGAPAAAQPRDYDVTTATRTETPEDGVGSTVTVISEEEIDRKQQRFVSDALRRTPGVDVRRSGGPGSNTSIFLRGTDSDHTLVLIDGIEINDPSAPSRVPLLNHLTADGVERIEVLQGPQSTLYGSDAIGGVVQIFTKRGEGPPSARGWAEGGSYATARGAGSLSGGSDRFHYALGGSHTDTEGFSASSGGVEDDPYRNTTAWGRFGFDASPAFGIDSVFRYTDARVRFDGTEERGNHTDAEQGLFKLEPRLTLFGNLWEQRLSFRFAHNERDTQSAFPSDIDGQLYALEWKHDLRPIEGHILTLGGESEWEKADFGSEDASRNTLAFFTQYQVTRFANAFGTVGLRVDDTDDFGTEVTYRGTSGYRFEQTGTILRASAGSGFKAPSLSQLDPNIFGGDKDLDAEESIGFDVGVEQPFFEGDLVVRATYFRNWIDDLIVAVFDPGSGNFLNGNVDDAETSGVEVGFEARLLPQLELRANYTFTDTEAKGSPATFGLGSGSRLLRRPRHKANLDLSYGFLAGRGNTTFTLSYVGQRLDLDPVSFEAVNADDYIVANLSASFDVTEYLRVFARVDNLFDESYEEVLGFGTAGISGYGGIELSYSSDTWWGDP